MLKRAIITIIILIIAAAGFLYYLSSAVGSGNQPVYFSIKEGASVNQIANNLQSQQLIRSAWLFRFWAKAIGADGRFVSGRHQLAPHSNISQLIKQLTNPSNLNNERDITIIEGWRIIDIADYLGHEGIASREDFLAAIKTDLWRERYDFLADVKADTLEGFLFPDTYRIFNDAQAQDIVKKMLDNFDRKLTPEMRREIAAQGKSIFNTITLASIIEREVLSSSDKQIVADIFLKRLEKGMGLQSDATINYITGKKTTRPSSADLQIDSPYNTYKYRGLPPGPISNPGLDSIKAAIYPQKNNYYYFLTASDGQAIFATTYDEHLKNIKQYLDN